MGRQAEGERNWGVKGWERRSEKYPNTIKITIAVTVSDELETYIHR